MLLNIVRGVQCSGRMFGGRALQRDALGPVRAWGLSCNLRCALSSLRQAWQRGCLWPELPTPKNVAGSWPSQAAQHFSAVPNISATA